MTSRFSTNEHLVKYIIDRMNLGILDGLIPTIHDPVMGYGGFLLSALYYLNTYYPEINWDINKNRISGYELNTSVYTTAINNIYQHTELDMANTIKNIDCISLISVNKYDIIMADLPKHEYCIHSYNEIIFIKYIMNSLEANGSAVVIVSNKIITSNKLKYLKIRRSLLRKFNVHYIVEINNQEYSSIFPTIPIKQNNKDYIIFFTNTGRTESIEIYDIILPNNLTEDAGVYYRSSISHEMIAQNEYTIYNLMDTQMLEYTPTSIDQMSITSSDSIDELEVLENQMNNIIL
jgi:type I restriction enzyme M protein